LAARDLRVSDPSHLRNSGVGKSSFIHRFCYDRFLVTELPCWPLSVRLLASSPVPSADRFMEVVILGRGAV
uniref:Uncharacterized protein n=1 Tax=Athene cunicularia TaxID=194338 RepID=A0A663M6S6_ATHCN